MNEALQRTRDKLRDDEGFTLIELLVVVVIIGVLVAIAVPVYLNYRQGAADKSAQSDMRGAVSTLEQYYTDNNNTYPAAPITKQTASFNLGAATGTTALVSLSDKTEMLYVPSGNTSYKLCASSTGGSGKMYLYNSATGGSITAANVTFAASCA